MNDAPSDFRVSLMQTAPVLGDVSGNRADMERAVRAAHDEVGADVVIFPELALTGYSLAHRAREMGVDLSGAPPLQLPEDGPTALFGMVERGEDHLTYNTAVAARGRHILAVHRKIYLPTYGSFDEGRIFAPGRRSPRPFRVAPGWNAGILVCEDFWHPALAYLHALQEADVIFVLAAAPGRGGPAEDRRFASMARWELIVRATAVLHGVYVVLCNRAGVEGAVTFAGGSMVVDPAGTVLARAPEAEPGRVDVLLERARVAAARQPYAHLRDEDPALTLHALERILAER